MSAHGTIAAVDWHGAKVTSASTLPTPEVVGQLVIVGSTVYIATGTSSSSDYKPYAVIGNLTATADPTASDDSYDVGAAWVNTSTDTIFFCTDNSSGAAVWEEVGSGSGAPTDATYVCQTANSTLTSEQALSTLETGSVQVTTTTGVLSSLKSNLSAAAAPTASDDSGSGYAVGSQWIDTTADKEYVCLDASSGAAVWTETTQSGSSGSTACGVCLYRNTNQTITGGANITWDNEEIDTDSFHDLGTAPERITIPTGKGGYYHMTASISVTTYIVSSVTMTLYKNGTATNLTSRVQAASTNGYMHLSMNGGLSLSASDYLILYITLDTSSNFNVSYAQWTMFLMGT